MTSKPFQGVITALVTPFADGRLDEPAFVALIERQVAAGVHGVVPVGTTGETSTLSHEEHKRVVSLCVEVTNGRIPVIAGAGSNSTEEAVDFARHAKAAGADASLVVTPYYNRPGQEGLYQHYKTISDAVDLPMLVYNVPSRTSIDITNETLLRVAELPNVVGIKDATGDMVRASLQKRFFAPEWIMLSGDDPSALGYIAHGGRGCISVTANVAPAACAAFFNACLSGQWTEALALQNRLIRLHKALFLDASPSPTKFALSRLGLCSEEVRLPVVPCAPQHYAEIVEAMTEAGVSS